MENFSRPPIRRIVTGLSENGLSCIAEDGASPAELTVDTRPGYRVTNLWRTLAAQPFDAPDSITEHQGVQPPDGGTVLRIIDVPPEPQDAESRQAAVEATFKEMFPDAHRPSAMADAAPHPGMHKTTTVDFAIMLEGELTAILDEQETVIRAGDVLIQRGTNHAWANRSGNPARVAFVLVDAPRRD
ncbi:MAG: cupin domain-containing protein [Proteobacteria bacterium]|nr:cupin domain-containing protein [Pseudomonadota bacterium]